jgi:hypothetical protein
MPAEVDKRKEEIKMVNNDLPRRGQRKRKFPARQSRIIRAGFTYHLLIVRDGCPSLDYLTVLSPTQTT